MSVRFVRSSLVALLVAAALGPVATAGAQAPDPPGGPVLVADLGSGYADYYGEILRAEGLNEFDVGPLTAESLASHQVVLTAGNVSAAQAALLDGWVRNGGNLIAMRPGSALAGLLGLGSDSGDLSNAYLQVAAGQGVTTETMQFHGTADRWTLAGATPVATLFSTASAPAGNPAATLRDVGAGHAAAFTFDLAQSVVLTRQGNPAWAGKELDGSSPVRSDDLFFGNGPDGWLDRSKVHIPQADEQQRLLANLITRMNVDRAPLPRFYYLPRGLKAAVVMTGDDHGTGGTNEEFDAYEAASTPGCSVPDWQCVRATSYVYPSTSVPGADEFRSNGFELALHLYTDCNNQTDTNLQNLWTTQAADFRSAFGNLPLRTSRTHCITWSGWVNDAIIERRQGVRLDTNYYYWPGSWAFDYPGMFTGSGFPMRFADTDGSLVDVYQAATQLVDEWGDSQQEAPGVARHIDTLLQRAVGSDAFYGVFTANMHTDAQNFPHQGANAIIAAAKRYGVPVVSAAQMLDWLDDRNGSSFQGVSYGGGQLRFRLARAGGARGLEAMVPASTSAGALTALTRDGAAVVPELRVVKGITYAVFAATGGAYVGTYGSGTPTGTTPPPAPGPGTPGGTSPSTKPPTPGSGVAGSSTGSDQSPPARAKVMKHTVHVTRRGVLRLQVRCPRSEVRCRVDVRLRRGGRRIAKTGATLVGGQTTKVKLRLSKSARARLMRDGSLRVKAVLRVTDGEAAPVVSTTRVRLLAPGWR